MDEYSERIEVKSVKFTKIFTLFTKKCCNYFKGYKITQVLGKGGFATVYKAICLSNNQEVAIKMVRILKITQKFLHTTKFRLQIDKAKMTASNMTERVRQEVGIHARLKHPSILELYTFFEDTNHVYLILELAHNGTLHRFITERQKSLTEFESANIMSQVVNGLLYLHSNNIMHRDISMSNLLLTASMHIRISDFGLATQINGSNANTNSTLCGTPNYISPEVASRSSHGLKTDVWSLGCLLFTILVGRPPFDTNGVKSTLTQVVMGNYTIPEHISTEARDLLQRLLCKDPIKRLEIHQVMSHPFMLKFNQNAATDSGVMTFSSNGSCSRNIKSRSMEVLNSFNAPQQIVGSASMYRCMSSISFNKQPSYHHSIQMVALKKMDVPPLNTLRLMPTRHKMKNVILSIMNEPPGEIVLEFYKYRTKYGEERVEDVCRITNDGLRIVMYKPNRKKGIRIQDQPPDIPHDGADHIFSYESLPHEHWKKYLYAHRFVQMVRGKTPKITFYSELAKCQLMESLEDFEAVFYKCGIKVSKKSCTGDFQIQSDIAGNERGNVIQHAEQCYQHCIQIERALTMVNLEKSCFPAIIGRRPVELDSSLQPTREALQDNTYNNYISSSQTPLRTPKIQMPSFSVEQTPSMSSIKALSSYRYPESPITPSNFHVNGKTTIPGMWIYF